MVNDDVGGVSVLGNVLVRVEMNVISDESRRSAQVRGAFAKSYNVVDSTN